jgi:translation initiation factor IF-2
MIEFKYKIKEMADDLSMPAKEVIELIGKFYDKPKSSSQNLTEEQLNVLFDYLTQQHQIASLEEVFAAAKPAQPEPAPAPAAQPAPQPAPAPQQAQQPQAQQQHPAQQPQQQRPAQPQQQRPAQQPYQQRPAQQQPQQQRPAQQPGQPETQPGQKPQQPERHRERRVIDTSAVTVNPGRYDDRVDSLVSDRVQNYSGGKQKIATKPSKKQQQARKFGSKSRNEEQEKMRKLQLEIAKKAQLVVKIPDEITVGELAARMKKTAAEVIKFLMRNGVMASVNENIDYETAEYVATELGCKVEREVVVTIEERLFDDHEDTEKELQTAPARRRRHGPCRPRQDVPARLYPPLEGRGRRGRRHHAGDRRLHRRAERPRRSPSSTPRATPPSPRCARAAPCAPISPSWSWPRTTASCRRPSRPSTMPRPRRSPSSWPSTKWISTGRTPTAS